MDTNRTFGLVAVVVAGLVALLVVVPPLLRGDRRGVSRRPSTAAVDPAGPPDRTVPPKVDGLPLSTVSAEATPPAPTQWAGGDGPVPSNSWWTSALTGPGAQGVWPQPLALMISEGGEVQIADPIGTTTSAGAVEAPFVPALFLDVGSPATTRVLRSGPADVVIEVASTTARIELTLVSGSPAVEVAAVGAVHLRAPGIDGAVASGPAAAVSLPTSAGPWAVAAADALQVTATGDDLSVVPGASGRFVLGPVPRGATGPWTDRLAALAAHPLERTEEELAVADDGTTTQTLRQVRTGGGDASLWALQPHHQRHRTSPGEPLGTVDSALGEEPVVAGDALQITVPAVPVLWSAVPLPDGPDLAAADQPATAEGSGSYFGGKGAYAAAARGELLATASGGSSAAADRATAEARTALEQLADPGRLPVARWEPRWGSVVVEPAEFGAGTELNDHQLQYGSWVAAASLVVQADPRSLTQFQDLIDLLIADYAGTRVVPGASSSLPAERTWSPYEGHSWASGIDRFGAGNNLESVSESSFAWWAAARWFTVTGRPDLARPFLGRLAVESAVTGISWLPDGDRLPSGDARPWSGVVWSGKVDLDTWFHPSPASALGIRLLPLGPASLARYATPATVDAARVRWRWCDRHPGCLDRWANLLDGDAAVAGRPPLTGAEPEPSTTAITTTWWRDLWVRSTPADGWRCTPGAVARHLTAGGTVVLASNPAAGPVTLSCHDETGTERWSAAVAGPEAVVLDP